METARLPEADISAVKLAGPPPQSSTPAERSSADSANISSYSLRERPQGTIWSRDMAMGGRSTRDPVAPHPNPLPIRWGEGEKATASIGFRGKAEQVETLPNGRLVGRHDWFADGLFDFVHDLKASPGRAWAQEHVGVGVAVFAGELDDFARLLMPEPGFLGEVQRPVV